MYNYKQLKIQFFKIEKHPKLDKVWIGSKSNKIPIQNKLQKAKDKLIELDKLCKY
jgi:hypothetical protein